MESLWNDAEAGRFAGPLGQRIYTSRLLGRERSLVLHGGGNTSVKLPGCDLLGDEGTILDVKGSGVDLAQIDESGFSPVRLSRLLRLVRLPAPSDGEIVNELRISMTRAKAPTPSIEVLLHAILPHAYVDHTHADAIMAIDNTADGEARVRSL